MDRAKLPEQLRRADRQIADGYAHIERQRRIVGQLSSDGRDKMAIAAAEILAAFEEALTAHIVDRERILKDLAS